MQSRTEHGGWVDSAGLPPVLWLMWVGGAAITAGLLTVLFAFDLLQPILGLDGSVAFVGILAVGDVASGLYFGNMFRPKAVRAEPEGIEVRPMIGGVRRVPWSEAKLDPPRGPGGFSLLKCGPPNRPAAATFVTADQALALRSSPFRPANWSPLSPTRP
ncbi:MAG TPA: hypothetical protein VN864_05680 [Thermoplasmata archaeon]|nr:hypothetical protein [Thermoplasmata archaeon]